MVTMSMICHHEDIIGIVLQCILSVTVLCLLLLLLFLIIIAIAVTWLQFFGSTKVYCLHAFKSLASLNSKTFFSHNVRSYRFLSMKLKVYRQIVSGHASASTALSYTHKVYINTVSYVLK